MYYWLHVMHFMSFYFIANTLHLTSLYFIESALHFMSFCFIANAFHFSSLYFIASALHFMSFYFTVNALHFTSLYLIKPTLHFTSQVECCISNILICISIVILISEHISDWKLILLHFVLCLWQLTMWCLKQQKEDDLLDML